MSQQRRDKQGRLLRTQKINGHKVIVTHMVSLRVKYTSLKPLSSLKKLPVPIFICLKIIKGAILFILSIHCVFGVFPVVCWDPHIPNCCFLGKNTDIFFLQYLVLPVPKWTKRSFAQDSIKYCSDETFLSHHIFTCNNRHWWSKWVITVALLICDGPGGHVLFFPPKDVMYWFYLKLL